MAISDVRFDKKLGMIGVYVEGHRHGIPQPPGNMCAPITWKTTL